MSLLAFLLFGLIVGLIARAIVPGRQGMGLLSTALLGMAGSFVGGIMGSMLYGGGALFELRPSGIIGSILGSVVVMLLVGMAGRRNASV
jgi:uncharacterized membrane protein YeaQ/YmgE (transglycosylase-associated protein family)